MDNQNNNNIKFNENKHIIITRTGRFRRYINNPANQVFSSLVRELYVKTGYHNFEHIVNSQDFKNTIFKNLIQALHENEYKFVSEACNYTYIPYTKKSKSITTGSSAFRRYSDANDVIKSLNSDYDKNDLVQSSVQEVVNSFAKLYSRELSREENLVPERLEVIMLEQAEDQIRLAQEAYRVAHQVRAPQAAVRTAAIEAEEAEARAVDQEVVRIALAVVRVRPQQRADQVRAAEIAKQKAVQFKSEREAERATVRAAIVMAPNIVEKVVAARAAVRFRASQEAARAAAQVRRARAHYAACLAEMIRRSGLNQEQGEIFNGQLEIYTSLVSLASRQVDIATNQLQRDTYIKTLSNLKSLKQEHVRNLMILANANIDNGVTQSRRDNTLAGISPRAARELVAGNHQPAGVNPPNDNALIASLPIDGLSSSSTQQQIKAATANANPVLRGKTAKTLDMAVADTLINFHKNPYVNSENNVTEQLNGMNVDRSDFSSSSYSSVARAPVDQNTNRSNGVNNFRGLIEASAKGYAAKELKNLRNNSDEIGK